MADLILLSAGPFLGWLIFMAYLEPKHCPDEVRWNHLLSGVNLRHFKPPCEAWEFFESRNAWEELLAKQTALLEANNGDQSTSNPRRQRALSKTKA